MKQMTYTASHAANFMLDRAKDEGRGVCPLKLIKLIYFNYGWHLSLTGERLFNENIYAWKHGPVVESIYHEFKNFRDRNIDSHAIDYDLEVGGAVIPRFKKDDRDPIIIATKVWDTYKKFSGWQLRDISHEKGSPWAAVYNPDERDIIIPDNLINPYFDKKIAAYLNAAAR